MSANNTVVDIIGEALHYDELFSESLFPVDVFPLKIKRIIFETRNCLTFPIDYIAASLFFTASVSIGNTSVAKVKKGWEERAVLYVALLGLPGTNKSHPLSFALKPLVEHDSAEIVRFRKEYREYERFLTQEKKEDSKILQEPVLKKIVVSDITPEGISFVHANNKRGICLCADELASWFKNFNRYAKGSEQEFWLSGFSNKPIIQDRRGTRDSISVLHSFIGVVGTIQHGVLKELAKGGRNENGFLDRILFVIPEKQDKPYWTQRQLPMDVISDWQQFINTLIKIERPSGENGEIFPNELPFDKEGEEFLYEWQRRNADLCNSTTNEVLRGIYSKLEVYTIRFALVFQIIRAYCGEAERECIDKTSVESAIKLTGYFRRTAQKVQDILNSSSRIELLTSDKAKLFHALPPDFSTGEGCLIAARFGISKDSFNRFLTELKGSSLDNYKHGKYRKII